MRAFVSEHGFRLTLAVCAVALVLMMATIYTTLGFNVVWDASVATRG
jgi:hypothetical protein